MPKYYVYSGDFKKMIDRPTPKNAAIDAFRSLEENPVDSLCFATVVSEVGFFKDHDNDIWFPTLEILEQSEQIGNYQFNNWE
jgi:hypothetical protein